MRKYRALIPSLMSELDTLRDFFSFDEESSGFNDSISLYENDNKIFVDAYLPGVDPKDIQISFENGILSIKAESKKEEKEAKYYMKACQNFSYRVPIPNNVDPTSLPDAKFKNGILTVTFEKTKPTKAQKIDIKVEK